MQDLLLWRSLIQQEPLDEQLLELWTALSEQPLEQRAAFFGWAVRLQEAAEPEIRAAGLRILAGAQGRPAWLALTKGLDDPAPAVRTAALESLRESSRGNPARWCHAVFHRDPTIRAAAVGGPNDSPAVWMHLFLLADPACRELVVQQLPFMQPDETAWSTIVKFAQCGLISRADARRLISRMKPATLLLLMQGGPARSQNEMLQVFSASRSADVGVEALGAAVDACDEVFDLFWEETPSGTEEAIDPSCTTFFRNLLEVVLQGRDFDRRRLAASLLATALRRGGRCVPAAEFCCVLRSDTFASPWFPAEIRRRAAQALYRLGSRCPKQPAEQVRILLENSPVRRASGHLDLWMIGALLHFIDNQPYAKLLQWYPASTISAAFWDDPSDSARFFCHYDASETGRTYLIEQVAAVRRPKRLFLIAQLLLVLPAEAWDLLAPLEPSEALQVFADLAQEITQRAASTEEVVCVQLAESLARRIAPTAIGEFLHLWLAYANPPADKLGQELLISLARATSPEQFAAEVLLLDLPPLLKFLDALEQSVGFPYATERRIAAELEQHSSPEVVARVAQRWPTVISPAVSPLLKPTANTDARELTSSEEERLTKSSPGAALEAEVAAIVTEPLRGLCQVLGALPPSPSPSAVVCAALLVSHDNLVDVAREFQRYGSDDPRFLSALDRQMVDVWKGHGNLGLLGHSWLKCWEFHCFAFADQLGNDPERWQAFLQETAELPSLTATLIAWQAVERILTIWRYRDKPRVLQLAVSGFVRLLAVGIDRQTGLPAARMLAMLHGSGLVAEVLREHKSEVIVRLPNAPREVTTILLHWINARGVAILPAAVVVDRRRADEAIRREIAQCTDEEKLGRLCRGAETAVAEDAALRLIELGGQPLLQLATLFAESPYPPATSLLAESIPLWPAGPALDQVRDLLFTDACKPRVQFILALGFVDRGERALLARAIHAACRISAESWFQPSHWPQLMRYGLSECELSRALAVSPQPNAYIPAVTHLLDAGLSGVEDEQAVAEFLESDSQRMAELRLRAAQSLRERGDCRGYPLLLAEMLPEQRPAIPDLLAADEAEHLAALEAFLAAGSKLASEPLLLSLLDHPQVDPELRDAAYRRLLLEAETDAARTTAAAQVTRSPARFRKLRRTAQEFAWGVRIGRELTGRLFTVEMLAGDELGYTRFSENRVYVNPLPLLRGEQNGADVLRGLIVHELGHHLYHRGFEAELLWKKAADEKLHSLLNLVADEHLERNLRALSPQFGHPLQRLAAYAFQHAERSVAVTFLLERLQERAFDVLSRVQLGVARRAGCVLVCNGPLLRELERLGSSFARFVRALRMGLGSRATDAKVQAAMLLFRGSFRRSTMAELYECAEQLRTIFGSEVALLDFFCQQRTMQADGSEITAHGEGIDNEELQSEVRRILEPPRGNDASSDANSLCINVNSREDFPPISRVEKIAYNPVEHARYAARVKRPALLMRSALAQLGLATVPQRMRMRGNTLDRSRLRALVLRNDPRFLVGRELRTSTDLFLGIVVDCSGSMQTGEGLEKARLFGTLLCEACRGLPGVDVRVFGFTDAVIYDAGDAQRCAAPGLVANGGNNDAAGLWHAAQVARRSKRRARLLVMISDGLPTECSTAALTALVKQLSQQEGICCAQVAVRPLEEICFPNYVLLNQDDLPATVRRFAEAVVKLVRQTMGM